MGDDTDYISLNLPPNLKLWRLMFFIWPDFLFHSKFKTEIFLFKFCKMSYSTTKLSRQKLKDFDVLHTFVSNILGPFTNFFRDRQEIIYFKIHMWCGGLPRYITTNWEGAMVEAKGNLTQITLGAVT